VGRICTRTGKGFNFKTNSESNARAIVHQMLSGDWQTVNATTVCTGSARLSSLPEAPYMRLPEFAKALRGIGFSVPAARVTDARGCL